MKITTSFTIMSRFSSLPKKLSLMEQRLILSLWLKLMLRILLEMNVRWLVGVTLEVSKIRKFKYHIIPCVFKCLRHFKKLFSRWNFVWHPAVCSGKCNQLRRLSAGLVIRTGTTHLYPWPKCGTSSLWCKTFAKQFYWNSIGVNLKIVFIKYLIISGNVERNGSILFHL